MIRSQSRHSARAVRTKRSAIAFAFGARTGVLMIRMPSLAKTASKSRVNLLSRSRIRNRNEPGCSWSVQVNWRACWLTPGAGWVGGAAGEVNPAATELDEEEHVQPLQRYRLDGEEVDREHASRLRAEKRSPGESGPRSGRAKARLAQDLLHGGGGQGHADAVQLTDNPLVASARILAREAQHQLANLAADRRATGTGGVRPATRDQTAVPAQQRGWRD